MVSSQHLQLIVTVTITAVKTQSEGNNLEHDTVGLAKYQFSSAS